MSWLQSSIVAILVVLCAGYAIRAGAIRRVGNPAWRRWAIIAALFGVALVINLVVLAGSG